jgi:hypothetical protein
MLGQPSLQYSRRYSFLSHYIALFWFLFNARRVEHSVKTPRFGNTLLNASSDYIGIAVDVIIAAILAMISVIIGANLIGPVATAVGGALNNKNLTGAANSLTAQLTLLFVVVVILIPVTFIAVFGKIVKSETA